MSTSIKLLVIVLTSNSAGVQLASNRRLFLEHVSSTERSTAGDRGGGESSKDVKSESVFPVSSCFALLERCSKGPVIFS